MAALSAAVGRSAGSQVRCLAAVLRSVPRLIVLFLLLAALLLTTGCEENDIERSMGKVVSKQVESTYRVVEDPLVRDWVANMGAATAENSRRTSEKVPVDFKVLDTDLVNAFAVPYGHVYLTTGLLESAESEDEIAGVVAHEWGHIVRRHSIRSFKKQIIWGTIAQIALAKQSDVTRTVGGLFLNLQFLKRSRKDELQADKEGVELSYRTGYDPQGEIDFFHTLIEQRKHKPSNLELYFMTHPPLERRIARAKALPELDTDNVQALVTIGRGYLARYRAADAIGKFKQGLLADGSSVEAQVGLADAYMLRGETDLAAQHYRAALRRQPDDSELQMALAKADAAPGRVANLPLTGKRRAEAQEALAAADKALRSASAAKADVTIRVNAADKAALPAQKNTIASLRTINGLYEGAATVGDEGTDLIAAVDRAVSRCNEAVYAVEAMHVEMRDTAARAADVIRAAQSGLRRGLAEGMPDTAGVQALGEAIRESERAAQELRELTAEESQQLIAQVKNAARVAQNTAELVYGALLGEERTSPQVVKDSLANAEARGKEATRRVREKRKKAESARTRTLVAEIDVLTAGADAYLENMYDGLLGYFMAMEADDVARLRRAGHSYGDIALALAAATSAEAPENAEFIAEHGRGVTRSLVDYVAGEGHELRNVNIMLKFAVNAMRGQSGRAPTAPIPASP